MKPRVNEAPWDDAVSHGYEEAESRVTSGLLGPQSRCSAPRPTAFPKTTFPEPNVAQSGPVRVCLQSNKKDCGTVCGGRENTEQGLRARG